MQITETIDSTADLRSDRARCRAAIDRDPGNTFLCGQLWRAISAIDRELWRRQDAGMTADTYDDIPTISDEERDAAEMAFYSLRESQEAYEAWVAEHRDIDDIKAELEWNDMQAEEAYREYLAQGDRPQQTDAF